MDIVDGARKQKVRIKLNIQGAAPADAQTSNLVGTAYWETLSLNDRKHIQRNIGAKVDGEWGPNTEARLKAYIACAKLPADTQFDAVQATLLTGVPTCAAK